MNDEQHESLDVTRRHAAECERRLREGESIENFVAELSTEERDHWELAASRSSPEGQWLLGLSHQQGVGRAADPQEAFRLFKLAAEQGYSPAGLSLAWCYYEGVGISTNEILAMEWFRAPANLGFPEAQYLLGCIRWDSADYAVEESEAARWLRSAAKQGYEPAVETLDRLQLPIGEPSKRSFDIPSSARTSVPVGSSIPPKRASPKPRQQPTRVSTEPWYFTYLWKNDQWDWERSRRDSRPFEHCAGSQFLSRGVRPGDRVYVVTNIGGRMYLGARMVVLKVCSAEEAAEHLGVTPHQLYPGREHCLGQEGTPLDFDRIVSRDNTAQLQFLTSSTEETKPLAFDSEGKLDRQTLRGVRRLTPGSAALLDRLLDAKPS